MTEEPDTETALTVLVASPTFTVKAEAGGMPPGLTSRIPLKVRVRVAPSTAALSTASAARAWTAAVASLVRDSS